MKSVCLFLFSLLLCSRYANATNYYVSPNGNDDNNGAIGTPWKTLSKISASTFVAGDSIFLEAGGVWNEILAPKGSGASGSPIVIDMYGSGNKPIINGLAVDKSAAFSLTDQSYWEINNLEITNKQLTGGNSRLWGILVSTTLSGGITHIYIKNCFVHDVGSVSDESNANFNKGTGGIIFNGYTNEVLVQNCHIKDVSVEGIRNSASVECSHVVIDNNLLENIYGDGIVLHGVKDGSAITHNVAKNVCYNTSSANYAGMWTYLSNNTLVAYNEVSGITGGGGNDGQPFDADISTNGDIFEYNYSHDNAKGFMLFMPDAANIIVRYNLSVNDIGSVSNNKRLFNYTATGSSNKIYNNTFYINTDIAEIFQSGFIGYFANNIIYCTGKVTQFCSKAVDASSTFYNNCFYPASITSLNGPAGTVSGNISVDPEFINPGYHDDSIHGGIQSAYNLSDASPCSKTGILITNNGGYDFTGKDISNNVYSAIGAIWPKNAPVWEKAAIPVEADTYTYDASANKSTNYGTAKSLVSKFGGGYAQEGTSTATGYSRRTYLKFNTASITAIPNIQKVYVRMRYYTKDNNYSVNGIKISLSRLASWSETGLTWNNQTANAGALDSLGYTLDDGFAKPGTTPNPITDDYINASSHYVYLDVTDTVLSMINNGILPSDLSFVLQGICTSITGSNGTTPVGNTGYTYFSKEFVNAANESVDSLKPTLLIYSTSLNNITPIVSSQLSGSLKNGYVNLQWTTYSELNSGKFTIQRSADGINFSDIASINAKGNSVASVLYTFNDYSPLQNINFYKFYETDQDGKIGYSSNIVQVMNKTTSADINIYPSPVKSGNNINISLKENYTGNIIIRLLDINGNPIRKINTYTTGADIQFPTIGLVHGIYILSVKAGTIQKNSKVIIE